MGLWGRGLKSGALDNGKNIASVSRLREIRSAPQADES
jgi:hypothetical protein